MADGEYVAFRVTSPDGGVQLYKLKLDGDRFTTTDGYVIEPLSEQGAADFVRQPRLPAPEPFIRYGESVSEGGDRWP